MTDFRFDFDFEEKLMQETLQDAFQKISSSSIVRNYIEEKEINKKIHRFLSEQGLLGLLNPSNDTDMNLILSTILLTESGKRLLPFPLIEHVLGLYILKQNPEAIDIDAFEFGDRLVSVGWKANLEVKNENGVLNINGSVGSIPFATDVETLVVPLKYSINKSEQYIALLIDVTEYKNELTLVESQDLTYPLYELRLDNIKVDNHTIKTVEYDFDDYHRVANLLLAAELLGISEAAFEMTVDYTKERKQFGTEIAKFQSIKHILADMHVLLESTKVSVQFGGWSIENQGEDFEIVSSIAKVYASDAAIRIVEDAIQVHGGVGYTWEHDLHLLLKRAYRLSVISQSSYEERERISTHLLEELPNKSFVYG